MFRKILSKTTLRAAQHHLAKLPKQLRARPLVTTLSIVGLVVLIAPIIFLSTRPTAKPSHQVTKPTPVAAQKTEASPATPPTSDVVDTPSDPVEAPPAETSVVTPKPVAKVAAPVVAPAPVSPPKTEVVYGTPSLNYSYLPSFVSKDNTSCSYNISVHVDINNWQGFNTGEIIVSMNLHSQALGDYPYSTNYKLSPGESKTFTHGFSIPKTAAVDLITASANVHPASGGLGGSMLIPYPNPSDIPNFAEYCY